MRVLPILILCGWSTASLSGERVFWTAKGKVTEVFGPGLQSLVAADDVVDVEFSYSDAAVGFARTGISPFFATFDFRQNIELQMEVAIGGHTWAGAITSGPAGSTLTFEITDVVTFFGVPERVSPRLSSQLGAAFSSFPGASATQVNELVVTYEDGQSFYDAVDGGLAFASPDAQVGINTVFFTPCEFTFGSGEIRAGTESVRYVIDLATLHIGDGSPPPVPEMIDLSIGLNGPEVQLSWEATPGKCYRVQSSTDLENWENVTGLVAPSTGGSYAFVPLGSPAAQYYRVLQLD